ncbi:MULTISPECIES: hypothetical protein [Ramlibacter]|uniref:Uncharacterized protein n=1 Tax=Ramlibacter aquaticus TaxID=2780094 RepID=A0ABR9SCS5_9BURK|nr:MULTISPECIES: hypothetical protein [Ramlibacter]MBE7940096.1 hypothetical protein [Ramlibacter aquaticus]
MKRIPLPAAIHEFLRHGERAGSVIIWSIAAICGVCFTGAVLAIAFLK